MYVCVYFKITVGYALIRVMCTSMHKFDLALNLNIVFWSQYILFTRAHDIAKVTDYIYT